MKLPTSSLKGTGKLLTREPGVGAVIAAILEQAVVVILVVDPQVLPMLPLQYGKPKARPDLLDNLRGFPPVAVPSMGDVAFEVTPIYLNLTTVKAESAYRCSKWCLSNVQSAFGRKL